MEITASVQWNSTNGESLVTLNNGTIQATPQTIHIESPYSNVAVPALTLIGGFYDNPKHTEAKILSLRLEGSAPIGYLMSLSAAFSDEVGYAEKNWFRNAAALTGNWALQYIDPELAASTYSKGGVAKIDSLFPESPSVLILDSAEAKKHQIEDISQLDAWLYTFGFKRRTQHGQSSWQCGIHAADRLANLKTNINLRPIPRYLNHRHFLDKVFCTYLPEATLPLIRFFYYYQILELLIEELTTESLADSLTELAKHHELKNSSLFRKEVSELQSLFRESSILNRLFSLPRTSIEEITLLRNVCLNALKSLGQSQVSSVADAIYQIRNQIFHNFRFSGQNLEGQLPQINDLLETVVPELLISVFGEKRHILKPIEHAPLPDIFESNLLPGFNFS